jgi:quinol monooxygenase YgiN
MDPLYLIAVIKPRPDRLDEARQALTTLAEASRAEDGCELYDLVLNESEPLTWYMLEKWASRNHWDAHMGTSHNATFAALVSDLVTEPIKLQFYTAV